MSPHYKLDIFDSLCIEMLDIKISIIDIKFSKFSVHVVCAVKE